MTNNDFVRACIVRLALKLVGTPYIWGGQSARFGFDCSGFVVWILQVFGVLKTSEDYTAAMLSNMFPRITKPNDGDLVFYGKGLRVTHVMFYAGNTQVVGASGGDKTTTTEDKAKIKNAMVKVKPCAYRKDFLFYCQILPEN